MTKNKKRSGKIELNFLKFLAWKHFQDQYVKALSMKLQI